MTFDASRVLGAAADCGLHLRNWSGRGDIVFAVYDESDGYFGTVQLSDGRLQQHKPWCKKDWARFRSFADAFVAREAS